MTPQDIEKLKAFCDEKGIEMIPTADRDVWEFKSSDKWDCDYIECIKDHKQGGLEKGMVLRALFLKNKPKREKVFASWDGFFEDHFKPSTKEDFDRYNESKCVEEPIRVECETTAGYEGKGFSWMDIRVRSNKPNLPFGSCEEFMNHIEESIEAFLNRER